MKYIISESQYNRLLEQEDNSAFIKRIEGMVTGLMDKYGLRYINEEDLDNANGLFNLAKAMTDLRGEAKFDENKFFIYFPLKESIIKDIGGKDTFHKFFDYDSSDGYMKFFVSVHETYKKELTVSSSFRHTKTISVEEARRLITDLSAWAMHSAYVIKKEWNPSQEELRAGMGGLRGL